MLLPPNQLAAPGAPGKRLGSSEHMWEYLAWRAGRCRPGGGAGELQQRYVSDVQEDSLRL